MSEPINPRAVGLIHARANQIRKANPGIASEHFAIAAHEAATRLCANLLKPGGKLTFDEAIEVAAMLECWAKGRTED